MCACVTAAHALWYSVISLLCLLPGACADDDTKEPIHGVQWKRQLRGISEMGSLVGSSIISIRNCYNLLCVWLVIPACLSVL